MSNLNFLAALISAAVGLVLQVFFGWRISLVFVAGMIFEMLMIKI